MSGSSTSGDDLALKLFSFNVFGQLQGAVTAGMIYLGDHLGLYRVLAAAEQPLTTSELAQRCGLHERWVREWAFNQLAAKIVGGDEAGLSLTAEGRCVLADEAHPAFGMGMFSRLPGMLGELDRVADSFRSGVGHDYDAHGAQGAVGIERGFAPWSEANLIPTVLPALDGVVERLTSGGRAADVGCGTGGVVLQLAEHFPRSRVAGYDTSAFALTRARQRLDERGAANAEFHDPRVSPLPADGSLDFVSTFDCIHDMAHPRPVIAAIRGALRDTGTWLLVDIKAAATFAENAQRNPMAALMYGVSVLSCMSCALSEPDGEGLGTLGLHEDLAREMATEAGFTRFRRLDIDHAVNAFYEIRP